MTNRSLFLAILLSFLGELLPSLAGTNSRAMLFFRKKKFHHSSCDWRSLEIKIKHIEIPRPGEIFHPWIRLPGVPRIFCDCERAT
ncbi:MAG: hypothetical protein ACFFAS_00310 [Promethearchaeota archaeon]